MKNYNMVTEYFGKSLMLVKYLESQTALLEKKVTFIKNSSDEKNIYEDFSFMLNQIKDNCEKVKEKLSMLALDLSARNEVFTEILDDVYLHQEQLEEIETGMTNKNIFCE